MMVCPLLVFLSIPALILAGTTDASSSAASAAAFLPRRHGSDMAATNAHGKKKKNPSPSQFIAGLSPFTKKQDRSASSTPIAKDGEKPRSTIRRYLWSRICLSYRESGAKQMLFLLPWIIMATVSDLCKLSRPSDLLSTLHCVFVTEGMWLFAALVPFFIFFLSRLGSCYGWNLRHGIYRCKNLSHRAKDKQKILKEGE